MVTIFTITKKKCTSAVTLLTNKLCLYDCSVNRNTDKGVIVDNVMQVIPIKTIYCRPTCNPKTKDPHSQNLFLGVFRKQTLRLRFIRSLHRFHRVQIGKGEELANIMKQNKTTCILPQFWPKEPKAYETGGWVWARWMQVRRRMSRIKYSIHSPWRSGSCKLAFSLFVAFLLSSILDVLLTDSAGEPFSILNFGFNGC